MKSFLRNQSTAVLKQLLREEGPPTRSCRCEGCTSPDSKPPPTLYRCHDCFLCQPVCELEMLRRHASLPFHDIQRWSACMGYWEAASLCELGLVVNVGHAGARCPFVQEGAKPRRMTAVHGNGIGQLAVLFCACDSKAEAFQLIEAGLWPASWTQPRTVYDIHLMEQFRLLSVIAHTNPYDFFNMLAWRTDPLLPPTTIFDH